MYRSHTKYSTDELKYFSPELVTDIKIPFVSMIGQTNATPGTAMKESDEDIIACESVADEIGVVMVCNLVISLDDTSTIMHSQAQL